MKTYLDLDVYSPKGRRVQHRRRLSRSFTQNLLEGLYIAHAQIPKTAQRGVTTVYNYATAIDVALDSLANKAVLKVASPGGGSGAYSAGYNYGEYAGSLADVNFAPAEMVGIVIGSGIPTVTPQDKFLVSRIPHGNRAAISTPQSLLSLKVNDNTATSINSSGGWTHAVMISPNRQIYLTSISFLMYRNGSPGTITCQCLSVEKSFDGNNNPFAGPSGLLGIATADSSSLPTNYSGPYAWLTFDFSPPILLDVGGTYLFILQSAAGTAYFRTDNSSSWEGRQQPLAYNDSDNSRWYATLFDLWGTTVDEITYAGCEVYNLQVGSPTASFQISRLFRNNGVNAITIGECGLQSVFNKSDPAYAYNHQPPVLLIAHDLLSPVISLAAGQVLQITYTPSISV